MSLTQKRPARKIPSKPPIVPCTFCGKKLPYDPARIAFYRVPPPSAATFTLQALRWIGVPFFRCRQCSETWTAEIHSLFHDDADSACEVAKKNVEQRSLCARELAIVETHLLTRVLPLAEGILSETRRAGEANRISPEATKGRAA